MRQHDVYLAFCGVGVQELRVFLSYYPIIFLCITPKLGATRPRVGARSNPKAEVYIPYLLEFPLVPTRGRVAPNFGVIIVVRVDLFHLKHQSFEVFSLGVVDVDGVVGGLV